MLLICWSRSVSFENLTPAAGGGGTAFLPLPDFRVFAVVALLAAMLDSVDWHFSCCFLNLSSFSCKAIWNQIALVNNFFPSWDYHHYYALRKMANYKRNPNPWMWIISYFGSSRKVKENWKGGEMKWNGLWNMQSIKKENGEKLTLTRRRTLLHLRSWIGFGKNFKYNININI